MQLRKQGIFVRLPYVTLYDRAVSRLEPKRVAVSLD